MQERTFDGFDEYADDYRSIHTENVKISGADSFYFAEMKVQLLQQWEVNTTLKVLDIGCGDGATELFIQKYFPNWQVTAIDVSEKSIATAIQKSISNATFSVYDGLQIPVEPDSFDIVFIAGVLHHVNFSLHETIAKEVNRVLVKEGRFYLFEHNPLNPVTKHLVKTCVFDKDAKLLSNNYAKKLLNKCGLVIDKNLFIIFFPRKGILSKLMFLEKYLKWLPFGGQYLIRAIKY
jgi:ubiquinone/menaquinone biosynthesis C-methylase UbiE